MQFLFIKLALAQTLAQKGAEYALITKFLHLGGAIAVLLLALSFFITPTRLDKEKLSAYECGFEPFESARLRYNIHYFVVAILFVVFDAEVVLLFPYTVSNSFLNLHMYPVVLFFLIILTVGFIVE
jgi:NADH-quinone oxidoreductase subunit A